MLALQRGNIHHVSQGTLFGCFDCWHEVCHAASAFKGWYAEELYRGYYPCPLIAPYKLTELCMNLGIIMARSGSRRFPDKNIQLIDGEHMLSFPLRTLSVSGVCDRIILSTDSEEYRRIGSQYGFDHIIMREPEWHHHLHNMEYELEKSLLRYEEHMNRTVNLCLFAGGNSLFIRPSWFRVAVDIVENYYWHDKPVHLVTSEIPFVPSGVFRAHTTCVNPQVFVLKNRSIICDIDFEVEFNDARSIVHAMAEGRIKYPHQERIHEEIFQHEY